MNPITYPARPVDGGRLDLALPKVGEWFYEPKYNGWRTMVHTKTMTMWNRHGKLLTIAKEFAQALLWLHQHCQGDPSDWLDWLDCEALERRHGIGRGALIVLDAPTAPGDYEARRALFRSKAWLLDLNLDVQPDPGEVWLVPRYTADIVDGVWTELQAMNQEWNAQFYEGAVAKRADSLYPIQLNDPNQTTAGWMKHRFVR